MPSVQGRGINEQVLQGLVLCNKQVSSAKECQFRQGHGHKQRRGQRQFSSKIYALTFMEQVCSLLYLCDNKDTSHNNSGTTTTRRSIKLRVLLNFWTNDNFLTAQFKYTWFFLDFCEIWTKGLPQMGDLNATNKTTIGEVLNMNKHKFDKLLGRKFLRKHPNPLKGVVDTSRNYKEDFYYKSNSKENHNWPRKIELEFGGYNLELPKPVTIEGGSWNWL